MSAIAGAFCLDGRPVTQVLLDGMIAAASPRGRDGVSRWRDGPAGLIRFAHATTPEAVGETQPFVGPSGAVMLFDGRLDNRSELLRHLGSLHRDLAAAPDGAIALALYERLGREFVRQLVGDYAVAIWEAHQRRVSLFRSPLGWRPLNWTFDGRTFAFATDIRTLVAGLNLDRSLNEGAIAEYLTGRYMTETETLWQQVQRVPQGGAVFLHKDQISLWPWHGGPFEDWHGRSMEDHVEHFRELFDQAITAAMRSNGPVTAQLSGGLDSSSIVCRATELYREGKLEHPLRAISARFAGQLHDETSWSSAVEQHLGITTEAVGPEVFSPERARDWCAQTYMLPVKPNALDTLGGAISALKADGRRVLLTGEGGDDWMSGSMAHWPDMLMRGQWLSLLRHGRQNWPNEPWPIGAAKTVFTAGRPLVSGRYRQALVQPHLDWRIPRPSWLRREWVEKVDLEARLRRPMLPREGLRGFSQNSRYAVFTHGNRSLIAETAFTYAESQGIEMRHPLHDARITRFMMGAFGNHMRTHTPHRKLILREAMRGTLPEIVRTRTSKAIFVTSQIDAFDALLAERPANELLPVKFGWVNPERISELQGQFSKWRRDGSQGPLPQQPIGPVWFALAIDMWLQHAVGL